MHPVKAVLLKHQTEDGLVQVYEGVPIGKEYEVDLDSITMTDYFNLEKQVRHRKETIVDINDGRELPTELLFIPGHLERN